MLRLEIFCAWLLCLAISCGSQKIHHTVSDLGNAKAFEPQSDGNIRVTCSDGSVEIVTADQFAANDLCVNTTSNWVLSSGIYRGGPKSKNCLIFLKTFFQEKKLSKVVIAAGSCLKTEDHLTLDRCVHNKKVTTCTSSSGPNGQLKVEILSHRHLKIIHHPQDTKQPEIVQNYYFDTNTQDFKGIFIHTNERFLVNWERCSTQNGLYTTLSSIRTKCGDSKELIVGCLKKTELNTEATLVVAGKIAADTFFAPTGSVSKTISRDGLSFYRSPGFALGFHPEKAEPVQNRSADSSTDFDEYRLSISQTSFYLRNIRRCGKKENSSMDYTWMIYKKK